MARKKGHVKLKTITDVSRYLARLINETRNGEVEPGLAGRLGFLCNSLVAALREADLEKRVEMLEKLATEREK